jgi:hypothetical protein
VYLDEPLSALGIRVYVLDRDGSPCSLEFLDGTGMLVRTAWRVPLVGKSIAGCISG